MSTTATQSIDRRYSDSNSTDPRHLPHIEAASMQVSNHYLKDGLQRLGLYTGDIDLQMKLPHGHGTMHYHDGSVYAGNWFYGDWSGFGQLDCPILKATFQGVFLDNVRNGLFVVSFEDGRQYDGVYQLGVMGKGVMRFGNDEDEDRETYWGYFDKDGQPHGRGKLLMMNGSEYDGEFVHGVMEGHGRMTYKVTEGRTGCYYLGSFVNGKRNGRGTLVMNDCILYEGVFGDDKPIMSSNFTGRKNVMLVRSDDGNCCKRLLGNIPKNLSPCSRYTKGKMAKKRRVEKTIPAAQ